MADEPIAVIGMAGRFPSAHDVNAFWELLLEGDGVTEAPSDRAWMRDLHDSRSGAVGHVPTTRGGFLEGHQLFDAGFFEMSPREAARMDPQQRLLLEVAYETAQDAGLPVGALARQRTGVFAGSLYNDFWIRQLDDLNTLDLHAAVGGAPSALAGRISYAFGWTGPSMTIDAACASSLVTVHLACQALRAGECDVALAAGANIILNPFVTVSMASALSPSGQCKFGDASADGYVRSEAVAALLLKPLSRALADKDRIRAVIRGSAVGHTGNTGQGISTPTAEGQEAVLHAAYARAGLSPGKVAYVEAHGTGTAVGDPVELNALAQVLREGRADGERCAVGSAKTVVGHAEGAAGVVGVVKAVLCLEHRQVPGNRQLRHPNPAVDWDSVPLHLPRETLSLAAEGELAVGVNSFGVNGTNAHVILTTSPREAQEGDEPLDGSADGPYLLALSARSVEALDELAGRYADLIAQPGTTRGDLAGISSSAARGQNHYEHRLAAVANSPATMASALRSRHDGPDASESLYRHSRGCWKRPRTVFVFPGQGAQWAGMGRDLLASPGAFTETMECCDAVIREHAGWSILDALRGHDEGWLEGTARIQPALWAMGVSLAEHWKRLGIHPDAVLGHSQGEIAAAQVAGALSLEQAGRISCVRAKLIAEHARPGALCWVSLPHTEISDLLNSLGQDADIAVRESAASTVLAGTPEAISSIVAGATERGINCLPIPVGYAAHSPSVDPVQRPLLDALHGLVPSATTVPFLSTVTAGIEEGQTLDGAYWWRNLREPVLLADTLARHGTGGAAEHTVLLQVSPHPVLTRALQGPDRTVLATLHHDDVPAASLTATLARLYAVGVTPDWTSVFSTRRQHRDVPAYPWQRARHWHQAAGFRWPAPGTGDDSLAPPPSPATRPEASRSPAVSAHARQELPVNPVTEASVPSTPTHWQIALNSTEHGFFLDHRIKGKAVLPAAAYLDAALTASEALGGQRTVRDVEFTESLLLSETCDWDLTLRGRPSGDEGLCIESTRGPAGQWRAHATMRRGPAQPTRRTARFDHTAVRARCTRWRAGEEFYRASELSGNQWRGIFRRIAEIWQGSNEALARLRPLDPSGYHLHPALLDAALQSAALMGHNRPVVLTAIGQLTVHRPYTGGAAWIHFEARPPTHGELLCGDITVADDEGNPLATLDGVCASAVDGTPPPADPTAGTGPRTLTSAAPPIHTLDLRWERMPLPSPPTEHGADAAWILLSGEGPGDRALIRALRRGRKTVITVRRGREYARESATSYQADHTSDTDLLRVLNDLTVPVAGIVHTAALNSPTTPDASAKEVQWCAVDLCASLLPLAHALRQAPGREQPPVFILTRGSQSVLADDLTSAPWHAPLWTLAQAVSAEIPQCRTVLVDLDTPGTPGEAELLITLFLRQHDENQIALREDTFYVPRLVRTPHQEPHPGIAPTYTEVHENAVPSTKDSNASITNAFESSAVTGTPAPSKGVHVIRADATYLVVGGLSGIGGLFADWLVGQGARHLLLTGRSSLAPDAASEDPRAARLARLASTDGVDAAYAAVDVADEDAMRDLLLRRQREGCPAVAGVVHSALALAPKLLRNSRPEDIDAALQPKVAGGWTLHRLFPGHELDFFVLFSSHLSLFAGLRMAGQVGAYAAANAFIDALASHRRARGLPVTLVNWSYWSDTGAASRLGEQAGHSLAPAGTTPLTPQDAPALFAAMLATDGMLRCIPVDWHAYTQATPRDAGSPLLQRLLEPHADQAQLLVPVGEGPAGPDQGSSSSGRSPHTPPPLTPPPDADGAPSSEPVPGMLAEDSGLSEWLVDQATEILGFQPGTLDPQRSPRQLGLDSLLAAEISTRLASEHGITASAQDILRASALDALAKSLTTADGTHT
ncbi:type I polyketide synthase [Streptomyces xanthochromogenes]|uniref:type I polyketide synthase n=1 Tax=Streptomyces xanthochromogenes TaxID=67384 RepID=UPI0037F88353